jgi:hypothetical protein
MTRSTYKGYGVAPGLDAYLKGKGDRLNKFICTSSPAKTASTPDGYGMRGYVPPLKAGSMAAQNPIVTVGAGSSNVLAGGPMEGTGTVLDFTDTTSGLSLNVALNGTAAVATLTGNSMVLRLTVGLDGNGTFTLTGTNNLAMIVPFEGAGSVVTMGAGATDLRGILSMSGEWTPFTELSPEGLANAVWNAQLAAHDEAGSAGKALATASSGGVDLGLMAQAVWEYVTRTLTAGSGATPEDIAAAVLTAAQATPIHSNIQQVNDITVKGIGTDADPWNPV